MIYRVEHGEGVAVLKGPLDIVGACEECFKRGVIQKLHDSSIPHSGSDNFKPFRYTPEVLRKLADKMERK